jgi:hypothetical protein
MLMHFEQLANVMRDSLSPCQHTNEQIAAELTRIANAVEEILLIIRRDPPRAGDEPMPVVV